MLTLFPLRLRLLQKRVGGGGGGGRKEGKGGGVGMLGAGSSLLVSISLTCRSSFNDEVIDISLPSFFL